MVKTPVYFPTALTLSIMFYMWIFLGVLRREVEFLYYAKYRICNRSPKSRGSNFYDEFRVIVEPYTIDNRGRKVEFEGKIVRHIFQIILITVSSNCIIRYIGFISLKIEITASLLFHQSHFSLLTVFFWWEILLYSSQFLTNITFSPL